MSKQLKVKVNLENYGRFLGYSSNKLEDVSKIDNVINIISCFSNLHKSDLYKVDIEDLAKAEEFIIKEISSIENLEEPKGLVVIDGKEFVFDKSLKHFSVGQMIDIKSLGNDFYNRVSYVMAVLYVNEDVTRQEAANLFTDKFPLSEYNAVNRFFFQKLENWKTITSLIQEIRLKEIERMNYQYGMYAQTKYTTWRKTLTEMWMQLRLCLTVNFYIGKNTLLKKVKYLTLNR